MLINSAAICFHAPFATEATIGRDVVVLYASPLPDKIWRERGHVYGCLLLAVGIQEVMGSNSGRGKGFLGTFWKIL
jgi:hypothetical protein